MTKFHVRMVVMLYMCIRVCIRGSILSTYMHVRTEHLAGWGDSAERRKEQQGKGNGIQSAGSFDLVFRRRVWFTQICPFCRHTLAFISTPLEALRTHAYSAHFGWQRPSGWAGALWNHQSC